MNTYDCRISGVHPRRRPNSAKNVSQEIITALLSKVTTFSIGWAAGIITYCIAHIIVK